MPAGDDVRVHGPPRVTGHRVLVINPNTSDEFTARIRASAEQLVRPDVAVTVLSPVSGPRSIESIYDELLSAPGTLALALAERERHLGYVIASDSEHPAVHAIRELTAKPVIGIAEASMYVACMVAGRLSIVYGTGQTVRRCTA